MDVFISYDSRDLIWVEDHVVTTLEAAGFRCWYADRDIPAGTDWEPAIRNALEACHWFVIVMSPRAEQSRWVQFEVRWGIAHRPDHTVPVLMEDCESGRIHIGLPGYEYVDFRRPSRAAQRALLAALGSTTPQLFSLILPSIVLQEIHRAGDSAKLIKPQRTFRESLINVAMAASDELEMSASDWEIRRAFACPQVAAIARTIGTSFVGDGVRGLLVRVCRRCFAVADLDLVLPDHVADVFARRAQSDEKNEDAVDEIKMLLHDHVGPTPAPS